MNPPNHIKTPPSKNKNSAKSCSKAKPKSAAPLNECIYKIAKKEARGMAVPNCSLSRAPPVTKQGTKKQKRCFAKNMPKRRTPGRKEIEEMRDCEILEYFASGRNVSTTGSSSDISDALRS